MARSRAPSHATPCLGRAAHWHNTFHRDLSLSDLETWPTAGAHAFSEEQCAWLSGTLRHLQNPPASAAADSGSGPALRRRVPARPAPPVPAKVNAARSASKAQASGGANKKRRDSDPVQDSRRSLPFLCCLLSELS